jgi:hypothetical protein
MGKELTSWEPGDKDLDGNKVTKWRQSQFEELGFEPYIAFRLAQDHSIDLEQARKLIRKGCSVQQAVEILA